MLNDIKVCKNIILLSPDPLLAPMKVTKPNAEVDSFPEFSSVCADV